MLINETLNKQIGYLNMNSANKLSLFAGLSAFAQAIKFVNKYKKLMLYAFLFGLLAFLFGAVFPNLQLIKYFGYFVNPFFIFFITDKACQIQENREVSFGQTLSGVFSKRFFNLYVINLFFVAVSACLDLFFLPDSLVRISISFVVSLIQLFFYTYAYSIISLEKEDLSITNLLKKSIKAFWVTKFQLFIFIFTFTWVILFVGILFFLPAHVLLSLATLILLLIFFAPVLIYLALLSIPALLLSNLFLYEKYKGLNK